MNGPVKISLKMNGPVERIPPSGFKPLGRGGTTLRATALTAVSRILVAHMLVWHVPCAEYDLHVGALLKLDC